MLSYDVSDGIPAVGGEIKRGEIKIIGVKKKHLTPISFYDNLPKVIDDGRKDRTGIPL